MYSFILVSCSSLSAPSNARISYSGGDVEGRYWPGRKATTSCDDGYSRGSSGWTTRTCQKSGNWNGSPKHCWRKYVHNMCLIYYIIKNKEYLC